MKTMKKVMLTIMMVMIATLVNANDNKPSVKVESVEAKSLAVIAYGFDGLETDIELRNNNGKVYYISTVNSGDHFAKKLDLSEIPTGAYTLEVENNESFTAIPVVLRRDSALVNLKDKVTITKPTLAVVGEKLNVILTDEITEAVWVSIFDVNSNRLAYEKVSLENMKRFDLSNLSKGEYIVHMSTKGKKFVQSLSLKK